MPIGENIRHLREAKRWTQEKLAEKCGVTRQHINGVENGHTPSMTLAAKLAKALGATLKEIV
ncbi:MAG TPA: helix-turn-helix transcriptional regulator [Tepidiformaceae bacterium]|jgi:transcriptional regulator with XRE-family HTH domain|nr:helix-turn-helix transcriptional regulator [Tepidiformaceae bacterium]